MKIQLRLSLIMVSLLAINMTAQEASTTVNVTASVQQQPSYITINTAEVVFGTIDPVVAGVNRFLSSPVNCSWNAPLGTAWHIDVYTANSSHYPGIVDPTGTYFLPMKYNHADLGDNDPNVDANWTGDNASFLGIFDPADDAGGPGSDGFVTEFTNSGQRGDIDDLDFYFALEVADDAYPVSYFGTVIFDLLIDSLP